MMRWVEIFPMFLLFFFFWRYCSRYCARCTRASKWGECLVKFTSIKEANYRVQMVVHDPMRRACVNEGFLEYPTSNQARDNAHTPMGYPQNAH